MGEDSSMAAGTILVVVATEAERPDRHDIEVLVCGVGKTGAATSTALRLASGGVDAVISFGVAGAYPESGMHIGDVIIATETAVVDEGLDDGAHFVPFHKPGMEVPGASWLATDSELARCLGCTPSEGFSIHLGRLATVSVCAGSTRLALERAAMGAAAEGMEGAAVAIAAARHGVRFIELRGISNYCGPREGGVFDLELAVRNAAEVLANIGSDRLTVS